ncbi:MAG: DUF4136 domain-containing protein [Cellvibrionales bacterium]|nr:DUF4136 domain-containing protein [Cellvibrionales bacterium]
MKFICIFVFLLVIVNGLLTSCSSITRMNRVTYSQPQFKPQGNIYVVSANTKQNSSLEFQHFKPAIEQQLSMHGFNIVHSLKQANSVAIMSYGIDSGKLKTITTPVYGYDTFDRYSVIVPGYPMPAYGVMGINTIEYEEYTHVLSMEIVDAKSVKSKQMKQLYTSKVIAKDTCPMIAPLFPDLVEGLFQGFPAMNAETREVTVKTQTECRHLAN